MCSASRWNESRVSRHPDNRRNIHYQTDEVVKKLAFYSIGRRVCKVGIRSRKVWRPRGLVVAVVVVRVRVRVSHSHET